VVLQAYIKMQRWQPAVDAANQALALELTKNLSMADQYSVDAVKKRPDEVQPIDQQLLFKTLERRATALKELGKFREALEVRRGEELSPQGCSIAGYA
jgi:hypothetical protein